MSISEVFILSPISSNTDLGLPHRKWRMDAIEALVRSETLEISNERRSLECRFLLFRRKHPAVPYCQTNFTELYIVQRALSDRDVELL